LYIIQLSASDFEDDVIPARTRGDAETYRTAPPCPGLDIYKISDIIELCIVWFPAVIKTGSTSLSEELILHHYWASPFSERARQYLALKKLPWRSVETPNALPKPDLIALTGGYRRAPVLQIGADIYCDTQMMLRELERRFPENPIADREEFAIAYWLDGSTFIATVSLLFGLMSDYLPLEFIQDRETMFDKASFSIAAAKDAIPQLKIQWRTNAAFLADWLGDGRDYLRGDHPRALDAICAMNVRMIAQLAPAVAESVLTEFPLLSAWIERVGAIGYGSFSPMTASEALQVARKADPKPLLSGQNARPDEPAYGREVCVRASDYGKEPVCGSLVFLDSHEIAVRRSCKDLGDVVVHFPRAGYDLTQQC